MDTNVKKDNTEKLTLSDVRKIATLAMLPLSEILIAKFHSQLASVLEYMSKIQRLNTEDVEETSQVTKLENIFREDKIDKERMFTQSQALANAKRVHEGYFVVNAIITK